MTRSVRSACALAVLAGWLGIAGQAEGHSVASFRSLWRGQGKDLEVVLTLPREQMRMLPELVGALKDPASLEREGRRMAAGPPPRWGGPGRRADLSVEADARALWIRARFTCPDGRAPATLWSETLVGHVGGLEHLVVSEVDGGTRRALLGTSQRMALLAPGVAGGRGEVEESSLDTSFLRVGIGHILGGYDHLLFVLLLVLPFLVAVGRRRLVWPLVGALTSFTVAHSLTLALVVFGHLDLPGRVVEPLIAASIAILAVENLAISRPGGRLGLSLGALLGATLLGVAAMGLLQLGSWIEIGVALTLPGAAWLHHAVGLDHTVRRRWMLAFAFGLIHGLGFAHALAELRIAPEDAGRMLLFFNLGVEVGQILFVSVVLALLLGLARLVGRARTNTAHVALNLAGLALAVTWFAVRAL